MTCWRVYDADLPEYAVAIDLYVSGRRGERWAHVRGVRAAVDDRPGARRGAARRRGRGRARGARTWSRSDVVLKGAAASAAPRSTSARPRRGGSSRSTEAGLRLLVNLTDYLDTGLFLDHRLTRARCCASWRPDRRFLNLFAYTGAATRVRRGRRGGARRRPSTCRRRTSTGRSATCALNGFAEGRHAPLRARRRAALADRGARSTHAAAGYDLVFLDPPTFSNSKRMGESTFDVQRDHVSLLRRRRALLADGGEIVFSTNNRRFRLDAEALRDEGLEVHRHLARHDPARTSRATRASTTRTS